MKHQIITDGSIDVVVFSKEATQDFKLNENDIEFIFDDIEISGATNGELECIVDEGLLLMRWMIIHKEQRIIHDLELPKFEFHYPHGRTVTRKGVPLQSYPVKDNPYGVRESIRTEPKIERNAPCPCGSGKKYKKCCINK